VDAFQVEEASLIRSVEVEIGRDGGLSLGRRSVDLNELRSELNRLNEAGYRGLKVIVAASPSTRLGQMTSVFTTCQDLGIPFEIRTKHEPEATEGPGDNEARSE